MASTVTGPTIPEAIAVTTPAREARRRAALRREFGLVAQDFWVHVGLVVGAFALVVAPRMEPANQVNTTIFSIGAALVLVVASAARLRQKRGARPAASTTGRLLGQGLSAWGVQRGVPAALVAAPLVALFAGLLGVVAEPVQGYAAVALAFVALPVWVAWRSARSGIGADEPVRNFHRYALWAAIPYVVFTLVRVPVFYVWDFVYWGPWYLFGGAPLGTTGTPPAALVSGALCYSLQGFALAMGFYLLFRRHSLLNALLYFFVTISSLYSFVFPVLLMAGSHPHWRFHVVNYWAHLWMGLAAWAAPRFITRVWPRLPRRPRAVALGVLGAAWLVPYAFAFGHAATWQVDRQVAIERAAFDRARLALDGPVRALGGAEYAVALTYGPRTYKSFARAERAVDADVLDVDARLVHRGEEVAWCRPLTRTLPSAAAERNPKRYDRLLDRIDHTPVELRCAGPAALPDGAVVVVEWRATLKVAAERETRATTLEGAATTALT